ncbi:MAG: DUF4214 domain-containing protein [Paracoccaceae bacterium]
MQSQFFADVTQSIIDADAVFTADLDTLNGSGVDASAFFALAGDILTVSVIARGLTPNELHIQHIHGLFDDAGNPVDSNAPTIFNDTDRDGFVEVLEGVPAYGDVLLPLENQQDGINTDPVADATGEVLFSRSYDVTDDSLFFSSVTGEDYTGADIFPLPLREIVIHGLEVPEGVGAGTEGSVDGSGGYKVTLPVAAGSIEASTPTEAILLLSTITGGGLAEGASTYADGEGGIALGNSAEARGADALAIGDDAEANGTSTTAVGGESDAIGTAATAFGWRASAEGERAHALGHIAEATGDFTLAIGEAARALTDNATAIANAATASGADALAIGDSALSFGTSTTAVGGESVADGIAATAFGWRASAEGERAHALGHLADASGDFTLAIGEAASASGDRAVAIGDQVSAGAGQVVVGGSAASYTLAGLEGAGGVLFTDADGLLSVGTVPVATGGAPDAAAPATPPSVVLPIPASPADPRPQDDESAPIALGDGVTTADGVGAIAIGDAAFGSGRDATAIGTTTTSVGTSTTAVGGQAGADGTAATAFGWQAFAEGERAHALGHIAEARGDFTLAVGEAASATGDNTTAIGNASAAMGIDALGIGDSALSFGTSTTAVGGESVADGIAATAFGWQATATGERAHALGHLAEATGDFTLAVGEAAAATGDNAVAIGSNVTADADVFALGDAAAEILLPGLGVDVGTGGWELVGVDTGGRLFVTELGAAPAPASLQATITPPTATVSPLLEATDAGGLVAGDGASANDTGTLAFGNGASASGVDGIAIGDQALADGTSTTAVGGESTADGIAATAFGWRSVASGERAHALGHIAVAVGDFSLAVGEAAEALSDNATAIGNGAAAAGADALGIGDMASSQGTSTTAVGGESVAEGIAATAFGWRAVAEGERAHALGHLATASGDRSLAVGEAATATGARAIAIGSNVTATGDDEVALGNADHAYVFAGLGQDADGTEAVAVDRSGRLLSVEIVTEGGDGGDGANLILGSAGADTIDAGAGDDKVLGSAGDDLIDLGDGTDTVEYLATRAEVQPMQAADGTVTISTPGGGTDTLLGLERIALEDGAFIFDLDGAEAAFTYRLYSAAFARTPDEGGLRFWNGVVEDTGNVDGVAQAFISSAEFAALYGDDLSNEAYVDALYSNVFGREADPSGQEFWIDALESGEQDREEVFLFFVDAPENLTLTAPDTEDGFFVV